MGKAKKSAATTATGEEPQDVFNSLKNILGTYAPPFKVSADQPGKFELVADKEIEYLGRPFKQMFFASAVMQKNYVSFYLMPVYIQPELLKKIPEALSKALKGKSCFHIGKADENLFKQVDLALKQGMASYKKLKFL